MNRIAATAMLGLFLLSASVLANPVGQNFQFYVTDNSSGAGIDAATIEVNGMTVCVTTKGFCEKVLEYTNGQRVAIVVTADDYVKRSLSMSLTSSEHNLIGLDKPSRGRRPTALPFGFASSNFVGAAFIPTQNPTGREISIDFTVLVQDVSNGRIPGAKVKVVDLDGKTETLTTDRNGRCRFQKFQQGRMEISVTAQGFADASVTPTVANKKEVAITLRVPER
ncbi:MAG: carboxypeptidase regulatory-like domain-containing protein [Candidatus Doudnabacteria bacterium]|nr:carboxypeptidase regulatory-like domain-containing protein [Candidatus Doudnabacteria bacterium]